MLIWGPLCVLTFTVYQAGTPSMWCFLVERHHQLENHLTLLHTYDVGDAI